MSEPDTEATVAAAAAELSKMTDPQLATYARHLRDVLRVDPTSIAWRAVQRVILGRIELFRDRPASVTVVDFGPKGGPQ